MKIFVKAKPNSKKEEVQLIDEQHFVIAVKESSVDGKANSAIIKALAKYLDIPPSTIEFVSGHRSKQKVLKVS